MKSASAPICACLNANVRERRCSTSGRHGGFSRARKVVRPVINDKMYGYKKVNVAAQRRDAQSLLNWTERIIRARKECPEISWGNFVVLRTNVPEVLAMRYDWLNTSLVTFHNFSSAKQKVRAKIGCANDGLLVEDSTIGTARRTTTVRTTSNWMDTPGAGFASAAPTMPWNGPIWI